ncbi:MAG: type II toxin-antitoxin system RelE/ParE family toxin [Ginsengibacter sp.]
MVKEVRWPTKTQRQLEKAYRHILSDSYQNAEKVRADIFASTRKLVANPEIHPPDKYKRNNDGSFRAFELHRYRIAYRITRKALL